MSDSIVALRARMAKLERLSLEPESRMKAAAARALSTVERDGHVIVEDGLGEVVVRGRFTSGRSEFRAAATINGHKIVVTAQFPDQADSQSEVAKALCGGLGAVLSRSHATEHLRSPNANIGARNRDRKLGMAEMSAELTRAMCAVRDAHSDHSFSLKNLERKLDVSRTTARGWMSGRTSPTVDRAPIIAEVFGLDLEWVRARCYVCKKRKS